MATVKCLVWDLDGTLWRGTLLEGDDVRVPDAVRRTVAELDARGILQSVASRNDHDLAWSRLEELGVAEYLVLPRIGWGPKSESVRSIADELGFAHHTIAFIDDLPAERAEVEERVPGVRCYPAEESGSLSSRPEFSPAVVTEDARDRRRRYQAGFRRDAARGAHTGPDEAFLRSLDIVMTIERASREHLARIEELTLRTSQMNATGVHYAAAALESLLADPAHEVLVAAMADRFGSHGAVGVVLLERHAAAWHLKLLATSCRVVPFGAGSAILGWLLDEAARAGAHLLADFRPTERNRMMEVAYRFAGFDDGDCPCRAAVEPREGVRLLHLAPGPRRPVTSMRVDALDLGRAR